MADEDNDDHDAHQHLPTTSPILVLSGLHCRFGPVGYRQPAGLFFSDLSYFFDALAASCNDKTPQFKLMTSPQELCRSEILLSPADSNCKRKTPRQDLEFRKSRNHHPSLLCKLHCCFRSYSFNILVALLPAQLD